MIVSYGCAGEEVVEEDLPDVKAGVNLVVNPSFEEWDGFMPVGWKLREFKGEGHNKNFFGKSPDQAKTGEFSYFLRGLFNTEVWMVLYQTHPVRPGYEVFIAGNIKLDNLKARQDQDDYMGVYVIFFDRDGERVEDRYWADGWTRKRAGTTDWRRDIKKVEVPKEARSVEVGIINTMTGYIYFDDIELVLIEKLKWEEKETEFVTFCWQPDRPFPEEDMEREAKMIEDIAREAGIEEIEGQIYHRMYPSEEDFMRILERKRYRQAVRWSEKELHTVESFEDHDMVHLILYDLGVPPMGIAKGLVFYFRAKYHGWDLHNAAKQDLLKQRLPALYKTVPQENFRQTDVSVTVPGWGSFVTWLIQKHGIEKFIKLYRELDKVEKAGEFMKVFMDVYGEKFDETDREWRLFLMRYECDPAADTIF